ARTSWLERELDIGAARIVIGQAVDVPGEAEDCRLLDPLDTHVGGMAASEGHPGGSARVQVDRRFVAEPAAQPFGGGERSPHLRRRVIDIDDPLDAIGKSHDNLQAVATEWLLQYCNQLVASSAAATGSRLVLKAARFARLAPRLGHLSPVSAVTN